MRLRATKLAAIGFGGARLPLASLDLQFATDKTLTARKGPTPAFTRATGATQVNAAGLIEYAPENSVPNSTLVYQPSAYFTVASTGLIDPDGAAVSQLTATAFGGQSRTEVTGALANVRTFYSVWVKLKEGNTPPAFLHLVVGDGPMAGFNTSTWSITNAGGGVGSVEYGNDGWVKLKLTFQPNLTTSTTYKLVATDANNYGLTVTAGRVFYVGSRNVSRNSFNHIQTTGTPFYAPRFDHDPVTLACKGLLIEESRTNLLPDSNSFNNWAQNSCATITSAVATPEGSSNAWKIVEDSLFAVHYVTKGFTPVSGTTYTASVWLKSGENGFVFFGLTGGFPTTFVSVNLSTGAVSAAIGTPIQAISASYLNGWWRVSFSLVATASTNSNFDIRTSRDGVWANRTYTGNGVNGVYCFGAQVEVGAFPTSYMPTAAATVFRSADVCSITGSDFTGFYNQSEGTAVTKVTNAAGISSTTQYPFSFTASSATELLTVFRSGTAGITPRSCRFASIVASTDTLADTPDAGVFADNATSLAGFAIKLNDFAGSLNGNLITDTTASLPTVDRMFIGNRVDGTRPWNGHMAYIRYYKKRLPDAKLQSLTL